MGKKYHNLDGVENTKSFSDFRKWMKERKAKKKDMSVSIERLDNPQTEEVSANRSKTSLTWIGHSTFLIQTGGINILTDPVWAERMGMQRRLTKPGMPIRALSEIDAVLISHGHYDHLDFASIRKLKGDPVFYVPEGLGASFRRRGYKNVKEAAWWDVFDKEDVRFTFVPAQHWTRRTLWDTNTSHWGGWVIEHKGHSIYFAGDSGYFRGFKEIGEKMSVDAVLMPIGAYEPEWFMKVSHINPEDAVTAYIDLNAKGPFVPMHYGAFRLADDTGPEALERLLAEWEKRALDPEKLNVMKIGETWWV
ncbi:MBL fold metallo-hydrolase [Metabacillus indicus]|uniref:MBL fold metallo-hydrolase n=1 Tax=Metabacillus indicus TaxID=246786 RepID=UPI0004936B9D|nr:MBL fold metallo-hydrolase [Metabacillus indicus]KEZ48382.1 beta-lactamase [Metabacillus indicus LMG 22858]